jgi:hypothetical protein
MLAAGLNPPEAPWAKLPGFLGGFLVTTAVMSTLKDRAPWAWSLTDVVVAAVWIGVARSLKAQPARKLDDWRPYLERNCLCQRCGHVFAPSRPA